MRMLILAMAMRMMERMKRVALRIRMVEALRLLTVQFYNFIFLKNLQPHMRSFTLSIILGNRKNFSS